jgi:hypothetical protein
MTAAVTKGSGTICPNADDHCCCKERKDPAFVAVKPHGPVEASILIGQTPMAIPDLASTLDFKHEPVLFSIPEFTSGAPPGVFLENNRARAPPICSA